MMFNMDVPFFEEYLREKKNLKDSSIYQYIQVIGRFLATQPNVEELKDYNEFLIKYSIKKRNSHYYSILKTYIEWKITDSSLKNRLLAGLVLPPIRRDVAHERRYLPEEKILEIINHLNSNKHRIIALIQTVTGVRAGDILRLKKGGIVSEIYNEQTITRLNIVGKGDKRNVVPIYDKVVQSMIWDYILNYPGADDYYFLTLGTMKRRYGGGTEYKLYSMNYHWYWEDLNQALQAANISKEDFATHDFRRCFARRAWEKWHDVERLRRVLNHSNVATTMGYLDQSGLKSMDLHKELQR